MNTDIFIPTTPKPVKGYDIMSLLRRRRTIGEIGLEIECETAGPNHFPKEVIPSPWTYHHDGSLRGFDNAEYVLGNPVKFDDVPKAIDTLFDMLKRADVKLAESNRTSVHVHLNVQLFHMHRLAAFLGMYFSIEELLAAYCGEHRVGNLFCLRAKDATSVITVLKKFIAEDGKTRIPEGMHYAGLNSHAITKYGSLEIRTLRGATDKQTILDWVNILRQLYDKSAEFSDPRDIPGMLSTEGPDGYLDVILGHQKATLLNGISFTSQQIRDSLYEGIRLAQQICYSRDWEVYEPIVTVFDPFGRPKGKTKIVSTTLNQFHETYGVTTAPIFAPTDVDDDDEVEFEIDDYDEEVDDDE